MSEQIEAVARAICAGRCAYSRAPECDPADEPFGALCAWQGVSCLALARAAVKSLEGK